MNRSNVVFFAADVQIAWRLIMKKKTVFVRQSQTDGDYWGREIKITHKISSKHFYGAVDPPHKTLSSSL